MNVQKSQFLYNKIEAARTCTVYVENGPGFDKLEKVLKDFSWTGAKIKRLPTGGRVSRK